MKGTKDIYPKDIVMDIWEGNLKDSARTIVKELMYEFLTIMIPTLSVCFFLIFKMPIIIQFQQL